MSTGLPPYLPIVGQGGGKPSYAVGLKLLLGDRDYQVELQMAAAATSDATTPLSSTAARVAIKDPGVTKHFQFLPNDGAARHFRGRHVGPARGVTAGSWSEWVGGIPAQFSARPGQGSGVPGGGNEGEDTDSLEPFWLAEGRRRGDTLYQADARLLNTVRITDTAGGFEINRHNESGFAQDGDAVTFTDDFEAAPRITFIPQRAKVYSNSTDLGSSSLGSTDAQFMLMAAQDLTISGFTMQAVLATSQAASSVTDGFSTAQGATDPENGDVALTADGDVAYSQLEDALGTAAATYVAYFDVDTSAVDAGNVTTVSLGYNASSSSTSFTTGASRNYVDGSTWTDESLEVTTTLSSNYSLRLRVSYSTAPGPANAAQVDAHGEDSSTPGVQYDQVTGGIEESMTPATGQKILWQATEAP